MTNDPGRSTEGPWRVSDVHEDGYVLLASSNPEQQAFVLPGNEYSLRDYLNSQAAKLREAEAALRAIEGITGDDPSELWSMEAAAKRLRGRAKEMQVKLSQVYRAAHASLRDHPCYGVHEAWREEVNARKEAGSA